MIEELLGKTAGSPENPPEPTPQPSIPAVYRVPPQNNCPDWVFLVYCAG
ncbi:MAG: hypothetical protein LBG87_08375 [Spirochaetaceae bacterium]|nr:hypothetical protein [Spirochaetaceae bacterium]